MKCNYKGSANTIKCRKCGTLMKPHGRVWVCPNCNYTQYEEETLAEKFYNYYYRPIEKIFY